MINPIYLNQRKGMNVPIRVYYIVQEDYDINDPIFRKIVEYCSLMTIDFSVRVYDSEKYSEDCEYITHLPAVQIYEKFEYMRTAYPEDNIIKVIRETYEKLELEMLEYMAKKQIWDEKLKFLRRIFKRLTSKTDSLGSNVKYLTRE
jgi:hypothetical protein